MGEMQFRFKSHPTNYHPNHFLYEIERSRDIIEILEALNKKAAWMAKH